MNGFGDAPIKAEGTSVPQGDWATKGEATIWFEMAFTKAQYTLLAERLTDSDNEWVRSVADTLVATRDGLYMGG